MQEWIKIERSRGEEYKDGLIVRVGVESYRVQEHGL